MVKNLPETQETQVWPLGREDHLKEEIEYIYKPHTTQEQKSE